MQDSAPPEVDASDSPRKRRSLNCYACRCTAIASGMVVIIAATIGLVCAFVPAARWKLAVAMSKHHALHSRIYSEALGGGDADLAYQRSDHRLQAIYTAEQLARYFQDHPELFQVPASVSMTSQSVGKEQFLSTAFDSRQGKRIEVFVHDSNRKLKLLGIFPGLVGGIPKEVRDFKLSDKDAEGLFGATYFDAEQLSEDSAHQATLRHPIPRNLYSNLLRLRRGEC